MIQSCFSYTVTKQAKRVYIEKLVWSEYDEIIGMVGVAISDMTSMLTPTYRRVIIKDSALSSTLNAYSGA